MIEPPTADFEALASKPTIVSAGTALLDGLKAAVGGVSTVTVRVLVSVCPLLLTVRATG